MKFKPYLEMNGKFAGYIDTDTYISDVEGNTLYYGDVVFSNNVTDENKYVLAVMINRNGVPVPSCAKNNETADDYCIRKAIDVLRQTEDSVAGVTYVYKDPNKTEKMILADKLLELKAELVNLMKVKRNNDLMLEKAIENILYTVELLSNEENYDD